MPQALILHRVCYTCEHWVWQAFPLSRGKMRKPREASASVEAVPQKTTIRDVARAAGVGIGTISGVLNSSSMVSRETLARFYPGAEEECAGPGYIAPRHNVTVFSIGPLQVAIRDVPVFDEIKSGSR